MTQYIQKTLKNASRWKFCVIVMINFFLRWIWKLLLLNLVHIHESIHNKSAFDACTKNIQLAQADCNSQCCYSCVTLWHTAFNSKFNCRQVHIIICLQHLSITIFVYVLFNILFSNVLCQYELLIYILFNISISLSLSFPV